MAIKIEMLRCFATVAQAGTLAEAARRLGRTQSAISMTLKQLEEHLGQRLFESDRKNRLTPLGAQVFELARTELRQFDETIRAIETTAEAPDGLVRVAAVPSAASVIFPAVVPDFQDRFPGTRLELRDADSHQVIDALTRGQADIGIASSDTALNGVTRTPLFADRFGLICSSANPLARRRPAPAIADIVGPDFVANDLCRSIKSDRFRTAAGKAGLTVHNTLSLIAMVRAGQWVTVLPRAVANIAPSELAFREISDLPEYREVHLFVRDGTPFHGHARELAGRIAGFDWSQIAGLVPAGDLAG